MEESIRTLIETKMLAGERGAYHLAKPIESIEMPASVQAILAARIDRLSAEGKTLLQTAAAIGKDIPYALLQRVTRLPEEALRRNLSKLKAAEFLYETALVPEIEYTFKHTLTHEVAYGSLLQEQRRILHARIAQAIEAFDPSRLPQHGDWLAHHAFRGELWPRAVAHLGQAVERALSVAAYRPAVSMFEQALASLQHLPETPDTRTKAIDLHLSIRHALQAIGEIERAGKHLEEAEQLAAAAGDQRRLGRVHSFMTQYFRLVGDLARGVESGERALAIATCLDDPALRVLANASLASVYVSRGDYRKAAELLKACAESSRASIHPERGVAGLAQVFWRFYLVACLAELGDFTGGVGYGEEGMRVAESADHQYALIFACRTLGALGLLKGDVPQAIALLERGLVLSRSLDVPVAFPLLASSLGAAYSRSGRSSEAISLLEEGVRAGVSMKRVEGHALLLARLGEAYLLAGRIEDATTTAWQAVQLAREKEERGHEAYALCLLGDIASCEVPVNTAAAETGYCQASALAEELSMRPLLAHCHLGLGRLYRQAGKRQEAQEHLTIAAGMYRQMGMVPWLEQVEAEPRRIPAT